MGTKHKRLYDTITSEQSLQAAYHRAATGKRQSHGYLVFNEYAQVRLMRIREQLVDETWQPSPLREFTIYEPKPRLIGAPTFADRVVHHALCAVIEPIFDRAFLPYSFACRRDLGTHAGVIFLQAQLRTGRYTHYLKTDFRKFFPSIDRAILSTEFRRKITCPRTVALFEKIVPPTGMGVPIGALTSQLSANIYGNILDQYLHHHHRVRFARYMDDVVILGTDPVRLRALKDDIAAFADTRMGLGISRWRVAPIAQGIDFLGYRVWPSHKLLRRASVTRAKRKIKQATEHDDLAYLESFVAAWKGHADLADSVNLRWWLEREYEVVQHLRLARRARRKNRDDLLRDLMA